MNQLSWDDFKKVEMRVGTVIKTEPFYKAINPSYKIWIDFGEKIGVKKTSAQVTVCYNPDELVGKQVVAVVNFPSKQIANFMSECLLLGAVNGNEVVILQPERPVKNGIQIG